MSNTDIITDYCPYYDIHFWNYEYEDAREAGIRMSEIQFKNYTSNIFLYDSYTFLNQNSKIFSALHRS